MHTCFDSNEDNPDTAEESTEHFLRAPKTPEFVGTLDSKGKKTQFSKTSPFDLYDFSSNFDFVCKVVLVLLHKHFCCFLKDATERLL